MIAHVWFYFRENYTPVQILYHLLNSCYRISHAFTPVFARCMSTCSLTLPLGFSTTWMGEIHFDAWSSFSTISHFINFSSSTFTFSWWNGIWRRFCMTRGGGGGGSSNECGDFVLSMSLKSCVSQTRNPISITPKRTESLQPDNAWPLPTTTTMHEGIEFPDIGSQISP